MKGFYQRHGKRLFDLSIIAVYLIVLIAFLPLTLLAFLSIIAFSDRGPIFFTQTRAGKDGKPFQVYKFRTLSLNKVDKLAMGQVQHNHPLATPAGLVMRRFKIDEMPQLWNVIKGNMTLVGPRPVYLEMIEEYSPEQAHRLDVPPGLTGWSQIHGNAELNWDERIRLDLWYVDHMSLWLDLKIIFMTFAVIFRGEQIDRSALDLADAYLIRKRREAIAAAIEDENEASYNLRLDILRSDILTKISEYYDLSIQSGIPHPSLRDEDIPTKIEFFETIASTLERWSTMKQNADNGGTAPDGAAAYPNGSHQSKSESAVPFDKEIASLTGSGKPAYNIWVVDDDIHQAQLLKVILQTANYQTRLFESATDMLSALEEEKPDLILLDIMMPHLSGLDALRQIREQYTIGSLPILLVTARVRPANIEEGLQLDANDYITKPYHRGELLARIRLQLKIKEALGGSMVDQKTQADRTI